MNTLSFLVSPAARLMRRLRLLPKFLLVTLMLLVPLLMVSGLLFFELQKSVSIAQDERQGMRLAVQLEQLSRLIQEHRALRHMVALGNAGAAAPAAETRAAVDQKISAIARLQADDGKWFGMATAWGGLLQQWRALAPRFDSFNAKQSQAAHGALLENLRQIETGIAAGARLRLDPEPESHDLMLLLLDTLPALTQNITTLGGRGAAYIDSGLLEANEDVMLNSTLMMARRDLEQLRTSMQALARDPLAAAVSARLAPQLAGLTQLDRFFERTKDEVLNALNQTGGAQFFAAAKGSNAAVSALNDTTYETVDRMLGNRIGDLGMKRNLIGAAIALVLLLVLYLLAGFYTAFTGEVRHLQQAVARAADGDLSTVMVSLGRDEIATLIAAFGGMNSGLIALIGNVRNSAEVIAGASRDIAHGNNDLSNRTEMQASSLEETAASMEQLTATVRQNAEHARQAILLAGTATGHAQQGGIAVAAVTATMNGIKDSSRKITDITGVIDSIAFQTNILALNAAVEAARAGEQGRGFAVVATEVRMLAQRSAEAAREIKALIEDSVSQVNSGARLVDGAGDTMRLIVASVEQVAAIINDIGAAGHEQRSGIEQINEAMAQLDQITQQNAALVEQAAAAAESLQWQAGLLGETVQVFKLAPPSKSAGAISAASQRPAALSGRKRLHATAAATSVAAVPAV